MSAGTGRREKPRIWVHHLTAEISGHGRGRKGAGLESLYNKKTPVKHVFYEGFEVVVLLG